MHTGEPELAITLEIVLFSSETPLRSSKQTRKTVMEVRTGSGMWDGGFLAKLYSTNYQLSTTAHSQNND